MKMTIGLRPETYFSPFFSKLKLGLYEKNHKLGSLNNRKIQFCRLEVQNQGLCGVFF